MICQLCHCRRGRNDIDGYVYNKDGESKLLMTGNWTKSMSCQPCDVEGQAIDGTELKEVRSLMSLPSLCLSANNRTCIF
jgi:hypothetical protein